MTLCHRRRQQRSRAARCCQRLFQESRRSHEDAHTGSAGLDNGPAMLALALSLLFESRTGWRLVSIDDVIYLLSPIRCRFAAWCRQYQKNSHVSQFCFPAIAPRRSRRRCADRTAAAGLARLLFDALRLYDLAESATFRRALRDFARLQLHSASAHDGPRRHARPFSTPRPH